MNHRHRFASACASCALIIIAALVVAACGGSSSKSSSSSSASSGAASSGSASVPYGSLPPQGTPSKGGTITFGQLTGSTPTYIFPIIPGTSSSAYTISFVQNLFLPLYNGPTGAASTINYGLSLASKPVFTDGDKTVTITMKPGYKWSNGAPVDAADMVFEIDLLKAAVKESPANYAQYTPGQFPTSVVTATAPSKYKLVIKLNKAYNPSYFLNNQLQATNSVYPLPATTGTSTRPAART